MVRQRIAEIHGSIHWCGMSSLLLHPPALLPRWNTLLQKTVNKIITLMSGLSYTSIPLYRTLVRLITTRNHDLPVNMDRCETPCIDSTSGFEFIIEFCSHTVRLLQNCLLFVLIWGGTMQALNNHIFCYNYDMNWSVHDVSGM